MRLERDVRKEKSSEVLSRTKSFVVSGDRLGLFDKELPPEEALMATEISRGLGESLDFFNTKLSPTKVYARTKIPRGWEEREPKLKDTDPIYVSVI